MLQLIYRLCALHYIRILRNCTKRGMNFSRMLPLLYLGTYFVIEHIFGGILYGLIQLVKPTSKEFLSILILLKSGISCDSLYQLALPFRLGFKSILAG